MNKHRSIEQIFNVVAEYYKFTNEELMVVSRKSELIQARALFYYIANEYFDFKLVQIGAFVHKNHATILHSIRSVGEDLTNGDAHLTDAIKDVLKELGKEQYVFNNFVENKDAIRKEILELKEYKKTIRLHFKEVESVLRNLEIYIKKITQNK